MASSAAAATASQTDAVTLSLNISYEDLKDVLGRGGKLHQSPRGIPSSVRLSQDDRHDEMKVGQTLIRVQDSDSTHWYPTLLFGAAKYLSTEGNSISTGQGSPAVSYLDPISETATVTQGHRVRVPHDLIKLCLQSASIKQVCGSQVGHDDTKTRMSSLLTLCKDSESVLVEIPFQYDTGLDSVATEEKERYLAEMALYYRMQAE